MSDGSDIEWCDATWQPTLGCERVSPGCDNCYAMKQLHRGLCEAHRGLTKLRPKDASRPGVDWNGKVRLQPEVLSLPLRWKKPRRVFVDSLSDLFHRKVPHQYIAAVFGVMAATPQHTYLVLTKRDPRSFFAWAEQGRGGNPASVLMWSHALELGVAVPSDSEDVWPLPNVHLGVSVEDQQRADERIPQLLQCPAAVHWVSAEPLLGPVDLGAYIPERAHLGFVGPELRAAGYNEGPVMLRRGDRLGWVVVGGESGPGARPFHIEWARSTVAQCRAAGVPIFVKQIGARPWELQPGWKVAREITLFDSKGGDMAEWPVDLRVRETPA